MDREALKKMAAEKTLKDELIKDGMILGMGSGTTIKHLIKLLEQKIQKEETDLQAVPTSYDTARLCIDAGIPLTTLDEHPSLDVTLDGADEVDPSLKLIKGGGAALTREKIVGNAAKLFVILVDESKLVKNLGEKAPLPLEVLPFAVTPVIRLLQNFGNPVLRMSTQKLGAVVTDNGNFIIDVHNPRIEDCNNLEKQLNTIPGILENGLFVNMADLVYVGTEQGTRILKKK